MIPSVANKSKLIRPAGKRGGGERLSGQSPVLLPRAFEDRVEFQIASWRFLL